MSYHILHIDEYGCKLYKSRGLLVCEKDGITLGRIALCDIRALVVLSQGVAISEAVFAELLANDAIIVHCKNYKTVGVSMPNIRTNDAKVVLNQAAGNKNLNNAIWRRLLFGKVGNCVSCLKLMGIKDSRLECIYKANYALPNEALCAKEYWKHYFPQLGEYGQRRQTVEENISPVNAFLNYGYGIMGGIIHRSLIIAGLNFLLGVNHKTYYKNTPLVYDVIEPFRAFVDYALYKYNLTTNTPNLREWSRFFGKYLKDMRVKKGCTSLKLIDATDTLCESLANAYRQKKAELLWVPKLEWQ